VIAEKRYRDVSLPMLGVIPAGAGVTASVRVAPSALSDEPGERFAIGLFAYVDGTLVDAREVRDLSYGRPAEIAVRLPETAHAPALLVVYTTRQAVLDGAVKDRKRFEESWIFLASDDGRLAVSIPSVPYMGSNKRVVDNHFLSFPGLRVARKHWRPTAYLVNPYPEAIAATCWIETRRGKRVDVARDIDVPGPGVRAIDVVDTLGTRATDSVDYGTLIAWAPLKPQGFVAVADSAGRVRSMDHFHPIWRS